ncbi:copper resistance protein [Corynebacterium ulcerans]|uniref:copper resistance CopC family protein n=1 Tax=Corynebacterium ulcerans TaxID=65058 RepID=UPI00021855C4|nr:copper resistance protein CopC [Corynebacterium ulcerans]AEG81819.1 putative secreted protein [Corynebacterium ulcerans 809]PME08486.1 copper resistance protein [Corynebacterium ulcerans]
MSGAGDSVCGRDTPILGRVAACVAALTATCALSMSAGSTAYAHDVVIDSNPVNGSTIDSFPRSLSLVFSGEPKPGFNTVAVSDASNSKVLFTADPHIEGRNVSVEVPSDIAPGPGDYILGFQITSSDGHATRGKTTFTVAGERAEGASTSSDSSDVTQSAGARGFPGWLWLVIGLLAVAGISSGTIVALRSRKQKGN